MTDLSSTHFLLARPQEEKSPLAGELQALACSLGASISGRWVLPNAKGGGRVKVLWREGAIVTPIKRGRREGGGGAARRLLSHSLQELPCTPRPVATQEC